MFDQSTGVVIGISKSLFTVRQSYLDNFPERQDAVTNGTGHSSHSVAICKEVIRYYVTEFLRAYYIAIVYFIQPAKVFFRQFALSPAWPM